MPRYPEQLLTDDESVVLELRPHWRVLLAAIGWLLLAVLLVAASFAFAEASWIRIAAGVVALGTAAALAVPPFVRRAFTQFVLTTERIVVRRGIVARDGIEIPLESISNVLFSQSVLERTLGYGDVTLESAGQAGTSVLTDVPDPEGFQSEVYRAREDRALHFEGGGGPRDVAAQLQDLAELHEQGRLTDEEFAQQKRRVLDA